MPKSKARLVTTFKCDRLWGRQTCDWFCRHFPEFKGRELTFTSDKAVELSPRMFQWLTVNGFL